MNLPTLLRRLELVGLKVGSESCDHCSGDPGHVLRLGLRETFNHCFAYPLVASDTSLVTDEAAWAPRQAEWFI